MHKKVKILFSVIAIIMLAFNHLPNQASALVITPVQIRWFVGLGTGTDPAQIPIEQEVVDDFNASQSDIELILEVVPYEQARAVLADQIANGNAPDIVGPVGWSGSNSFHDEWLDLEPLITAASYDTSQFPQELVDLYNTDIGQEGLPFALFPSAVYFNMPLFVEAGLYYPPSRYGEQYEMPDGTMVDWNWDTVATIGKLLTLDANGKNATEVGFDPNNIVQYGFHFQWQSSNSIGTYWQSDSMLVPGGTPGNYQAQVPSAWNAAWEWTYEGVWGAQPFMPNGLAESNLGGNTFNSGQVAMVEVPIWLTCCMGNVTSWEAAAMPSYNGQVAGRIDADTFRILKDSQHPQEAFTALAYLIGEGVQKLIIGSPGNPSAYGAVPARESDYQAWRVAKHQQFPWVQNWRTILAGFDYPDIPNSEGWVPNFNRASSRGEEFRNLLFNNPGLDLNTEIENYRADLEVIFNAAPPSDISLSNNSVDEDQPSGTFIGMLTTTDSDSFNFNYSLCGGEEVFFQIDGDSLQSAQMLDFEAQGSYSVCVRSTDDFGLDTTKFFTINVNDLLEFNSVGAQDGWILESTETSGVGGTMNAGATTLRIGDDAANKQYRTILSFDTSGLPEGATVTSATLMFKYAGKTGTLPFGTHGNLMVDIIEGAFSNSTNLQLGDFKAASNKNNALAFTNVKYDDWYIQELNVSDLEFINLQGVTQFRLRFNKDDNNDFGADFLRIFSGNDVGANQPILIIEYTP